MAEAVSILVMLATLAVTWWVIRGVSGFWRTPDARKDTAPTAEEVAGLVDAFTRLRDLELAGLAMDRTAGTLRLTFRQASLRMRFAFVGFMTAVMVGSAMATQGPRLSATYLMVLLAPVAMLSLFSLARGRAMVVIDLLKRRITRSGLFGLPKTLYFADIREVVLVEERFNFVPSGFAVRFRTPQGRADWTLLQWDHRHEDSASEGVEWFRRALGHH